VKLDSLVLATDGSADAAHARRAVIDIARGTGIPVHVVSAWNLHATAYGSAYVLNDVLAGQYATEARALVEAECAELTGGGVTAVTAHVECGRPSDVILSLADRVNCGLVVVGCRGQGPLARLALGSVSDSVVREAGLPVLVVRHGDTAWPPERVVVGYDGSPEAVVASRLGATLAECVDAPLTVLEVVPVLSEGDLAVQGVDRLEIVDDRRADLEKRLDVMLDPPPRGVAVEVEIGHPAALLIAAAEGPPPALLAVGRRGIGLMRHMLLGSVSTKVLHGAPGAVLVTPYR